MILKDVKDWFGFGLVFFCFFCFINEKRLTLTVAVLLQNTGLKTDKAMYCTFAI